MCVAAPEAMVGADFAFSPFSFLSACAPIEVMLGVHPLRCAVVLLDTAATVAHAATIALCRPARPETYGADEAASFRPRRMLSSRPDRVARVDLGGIMSQIRYGIMLLLALDVSVLTECSKDQVLSQSENRTVTTFGGTCGTWQTTDPKTGVVTFVVATCGPGLECFPGAWKVVSPADRSGRDFKICLFPGSTCSADAKCPAPLGCASGYGVDSGAACLLKCQTNADCPDEFQICDGSCEFALCPQPGADGGPDYCPADSHCQDGSCRTGNR